MIVPRFTQEQCVIISDGSVESLMACAMASEQQQISGNERSVLLPGWWEGTQEIDLMISAVDPAVVRQASVYGLEVFPQQAVYPPEISQSSANDELCSVGPIQSQILLEASSIAMQSGIRRVVWPIRVIRPESTAQMDRFVDQIAIAVDRAVLASRLASLDANSSSAVDVVIETPFVDLSNDQMWDLAGDMALPIETCWWHDGRTLPNGQERYAYWSRLNMRSQAQIEAKSPSSLRV